MQLPVSGHPLHTRSLTLVVSQGEGGRWRARGDVIDLRKVGFVPMQSDIQPAGIIHQMSIELDVDPATTRIESVAVDQPVVAIEASAQSGGESCRDPARRLTQLAGERLDGAFARRLTRAFAGPLGCSHLLTLFQLMASGLEQAFALEAGRGDARVERRAGERLFRRAAFVDGFDAGDDELELSVQLADFHTRPLRPGDGPFDRLAGQWDVRVFARVSGVERRLSQLLLADRHRTGASLVGAPWRDQRARVATLEGAPIIGGLARQLFERFDAPEDRRLLDATLQLAPGTIQVMAAVMDRWLARMQEAGGGSLAEPVPAAGGPVGGMADSCYMWRSDGPTLRLRGQRG